MKSVGYLARGHEYAQGKVSEEVFERLFALVKLPCAGWFGYHECDIDSCTQGGGSGELLYKGEVLPSRCSTDIWVPGKNCLYAAPALILHYIRAHRYLPPDCFLEAVLRCPTPGSPEHLDAIQKATPDNPRLPFYEAIRIMKLNQCSSEM